MKTIVLLLYLQIYNKSIHEDLLIVRFVQQRCYSQSG
jgi:hypothetical protein